MPFSFIRILRFLIFRLFTIPFFLSLSFALSLSIPFSSLSLCIYLFISPFLSLSLSFSLCFPSFCLPLSILHLSFSLPPTPLYLFSPNLSLPPPFFYFFHLFAFSNISYSLVYSYFLPICFIISSPLLPHSPSVTYLSSFVSSLRASIIHVSRLPVYYFR